MKKLRSLVLSPVVAAALSACGPTADFDASVDVRDVTTPRDVSDVTVVNDVMDASSSDASMDADATSPRDVVDVTDAPSPMDVTDASSTDVTDATSPTDVVDSGLIDVRDVVDSGADSGVDVSVSDVRSDTGIGDTGIGDSGIGDTGVVIPPTVDGVISANEYGVHTDGQNQRTESSTSVTWFMRSTDVGLYVAVVGANLTEGAVLYLGASASGDAGSAMDGTLTGFSTYDNTRLDPMPFRASFVAYFKNGYQELRRWNGADSWGPAITTGTTYASSAAGSVREFLIPWTSIRAAGRPASFAFTGYVTSAGGFAYGEMPPENPGGNIGTSAVFSHFYRVADSSPVGGTPPFSARVP